MYRIAVAALFVAATGCATTGGGSSRGGNAAVAGIVRLPETGLQGNPCDNVRVVVSPAGTPTAALGDASVKLSRGRCTYTVSGLPSGSDLQIGVTVGSDLKCASGTAPSATPASGALKLRDYETATRDFQLACGA